jgi:protein required for attachment to host cells
MLIPHGTIIAVADGQNLALFRNNGTEAEAKLAALPAPSLDEHNHSAGGHHAPTASEPSHHRMEEDTHSAAVARWLNREVLEHRISDLVIVAPPAALGEMRLHYHKQLARVLRHELAKELTGRSGAEVLAALRA